MIKAKYSASITDYKNRWWNLGSGCVAAYQPVGANDYQESKINLANPGVYDASEGVAPTWDAVTGWAFNGSTQYLSSGVVPVNNQGWSVIARFSEYTSGDDCICGMYEDIGGTRCFGLTRAGTWTAFRNGANYAITLGNILGGVLAVAGNKAYNEGAVLDFTIGTAAGVFNQPIYIGANAYNSGEVYNPFDGNIQALAIYNVVLTAGQVHALTVAMNAL